MLRGILVAFVFLTVTAVLGTAAIVGELVFPGRNLCFRIGRIWSRLHLLAAGCQVRYEGHENLDRRAPCVFVSNNQSNLDIWALAIVLPLSTRVVAKASLFRIPIFGGAMRSAGFISIDRSDREKAIRSLDAAHTWLRAGNPILDVRRGHTEPRREAPSVQEGADPEGRDRYTFDFARDDALIAKFGSEQLAG